MQPVPENFKRRLLEELASQIPARASTLPGGAADPARELGRSRGTRWANTSTRVWRRGTGWLAAAAVATAASAAAVVIASGVTSPGVPRRVPAAGNSMNSRPVASRSAGARPVTGRLSARQILLDAAVVAAARPVGSGTYWYVKAVYDIPGGGGRQTQQTWTRRDGSTWLLDPAGTGVWPESGPGGFSVGFKQLSFGQLQQLPASPAALKTWVARAFRPTGQASVQAYARQGDVAVALSSLLYEMPAPPAVRAAAFRAIATLPNVRRLGAVEGGQGLLIRVPRPPADKFPSGAVPPGAGKIKLVIDPVTSQVRSFTNYQGTEKIITEVWTNRIPRIIQPPAKKTFPRHSRVKAFNR